MRKFVFGHMRTVKAQISLRIRAVWSGPSLSANRIIGFYRMYQRRFGWYFAHTQGGLNLRNVCIFKRTFSLHADPCGLYGALQSSIVTTQLAFYVNLHRAVIGQSATLTGRWRPDIDLRRMLTGNTQVQLSVTKRLPLDVIPNPGCNKDQNMSHGTFLIRLHVRQVNTDQPALSMQSCRKCCTPAHVPKPSQVEICKLSWFSKTPFLMCVRFHCFTVMFHRWSFSPYRWFKKGSCQFLAKECAHVLVNCLED